jgi:serine/threonine-protein kinase
MMRIDGRYRVERELGRGAMGQVLLAIDEELDRKVAIKIIATELMAEGDFAARFRREATALAALRHDNVVQVYALGQHEGSAFFAMEYVEGRTLDALVTEHTEHLTYVPLRRALSILRQIASGLTAVHLAGLVHRDVKPANIVIEEATGRPVLVDFGLVRKIEVGAPRIPQVRTKGLGTPAYAAPEQVGGSDGVVFASRITPRADIYAFGCTAFEVLTGEPPFVSDDPYEVIAAHPEKPAPKPSSRRPELAMLDPIFVRALAKDPNRRYESAEAFADALLAMAAGETASARAAAAEAGTTRILIVAHGEEALAFAEIVRRHFTQHSPQRPVTFVFAEDASQAIAQARLFDPDVVFFDDQPGGVALLSELRDLPRGAAIRGVVRGDAVQTWRYGVLGVRSFLKKNATEGDVSAALRGLGV